MKIKLLIATGDSNYAMRLTEVLSKNENSTYDIALCTDITKLPGMVKLRRYDAVLFDNEFITECPRGMVSLPILLYDELSFDYDEKLSEEIAGIKQIRKYQRISSISKQILGLFADVVTDDSERHTESGKVIAVWSPAGGVGKTTVAIAAAARSVCDGLTSTYLSIEYFSGSEAFFPKKGQSVSELFEKLEGNVQLAVQSVRSIDSDTGVHYFGCPENPDDINELTPEDAVRIVSACASVSDMTFVDLPASCTNLSKAVFSIADTILIVTDDSLVSSEKLRRFLSGSSAAGEYAHKSVIIANKGSDFSSDIIPARIELQKVFSSDPVGVYKTLSSHSFLSA